MGSTPPPAPLSISAGGRPTATILAPTDGSSFRAGDVISFSGGATDPDDGTLPASAFSWNIDFLHEGHSHPGTPVTGVSSGTFTVPTSGHDFSGNTRYRVSLTVTDSTRPDRHQVGRRRAVQGESDLRHRSRGSDALPRRHRQTTPFVYDTLIGFQHTVRRATRRAEATTTHSRRGRTAAPRRTPWSRRRRRRRTRPRTTWRHSRAGRSRSCSRPAPRHRRRRRARR